MTQAARERAREEAGGPTNQDISVLVIYFYQGETFLDVDNIAKSVLDGLKGVLFRDDQQVSELLVRKTQLSAGLPLTGASPYSLDTIERMSLGVPTSFRYAPIRHPITAGYHEYRR